VNEAAPLSRTWSLLKRYARVYMAWVFLAVVCLVWSIVALPAYLLLPVRSATIIGRSGIRTGFRFLVGVLQWMGIYRFDLRELCRLSQESRVILAPNHPRLIDAIVLLACHPNMVCVMKTGLRKNPFLSAGARLARFISNTPPRRMIKEAIDALNDGGVLLLFPEGTRSVRAPVNEFQLTVGAIAKHAKVPVLTVLIETESPYLSKGWPVLRVPRLPIAYRVRLGRRFNPPVDAQQFTRELEAYFRHELPNYRHIEYFQGNKAIRVG
jgi:1-acyl-sn-glycerol-3-phosphate acyltransferase